MAGDHHGTAVGQPVGVGLEPGQLRDQEVELLVVHRAGVGPALGGDHPRPLKDVGVEADQRDERRIQGEVGARLGHGAPHQPPGIWARGRAFTAQKLVRNAASVAQPRSELREAVVVAGDREDRPVVGAERLVELVVVVLGFAEVVDDVAQVKEERGRVRTARRHVPGHGVGDASLVGDRRHPGGTGVTDGVERDPAGRLDLSDHRGGQDVRQLHARRIHTAAAARAGAGSGAACSRPSCSTARWCCRSGSWSRRVRAGGRRRDVHPSRSSGPRIRRPSPLPPEAPAPSSARRA